MSLLDCLFHGRRPRMSLRVAAWSRFRTWLMGVLLSAALVGGCSQTSPNGSYGGPQNHLHDLLVLSGVPHTVLLATHIGLYRSHDDGHSWAEVAGGSRQIMDGLMLFKLSQSPVDANRVYLLAIPRNDNSTAARATPGLYTSGDAGQTWQLAAPLASFPTHFVYSIGAGSRAGKVFAVVQAFGSRGLLASDDAGSHWRQLPPLPTASLTGVRGDPSHPGRVLVWSNTSGLLVSDDDGVMWSAAPGIAGGIYSVSIAGTMIYAAGDEGLYVSQDDGAHFTLVDQNDTFTSVVATAAVPRHAYAITGSAVYETTDGGTTWHRTAAPSAGNGMLGVDPADANIAYIGLSYPLGVKMTTNGGAQWQSVLP
jgi:photosystem II stability/assembly factor-like uncharacterized protein